MSFLSLIIFVKSPAPSIIFFLLFFEFSISSSQQSLSFRAGGLFINLGNITYIQLVQCLHYFSLVLILFMHKERWGWFVEFLLSTLCFAILFWISWCLIKQTKRCVSKGSQPWLALISMQLWCLNGAVLCKVALRELTLLYKQLGLGTSPQTWFYI